MTNFMIDLKDCKISREPGFNRIRHIPTGHCTACVDDDVSDAELVEGLIKDMQFRASRGIPLNDVITIRSLETSNGS